jgi:hypothetical protein
VRRRFFLLVVLAASVSAAFPALAGNRLRATAFDSSVPVERFRFHAGASLLAPAGVGSDGSVCVGTADGYIHMLGPDGSFRWSFSVHGAVTRRPIFVGQLWFVATSFARIYALTTEGALFWVFRPPSAPVSELAPDATGIAYFVGADQFLYGVSSRGGVVLRTQFGAPKAGPTEAADGVVWAENLAGNVIRVRGQDVRRLAPETKPEFDFGVPDLLRDPDGHEWRALAGGALEYCSSASGSPVAIELTTSALFGLVWSPLQRYALVSARDGLVVAFAAPSGSRAP